MTIKGRARIHVEDLEEVEPYMRGKVCLLEDEEVADQARLINTGEQLEVVLRVRTYAHMHVCTRIGRGTRRRSWVRRGGTLQLGGGRLEAK